MLQAVTHTAGRNHGIAVLPQVGGGRTAFKTHSPLGTEELGDSDISKHCSYILLEDDMMSLRSLY